MTAVTGGGAADARAEMQALRRCISDVVALSTLSAMWAGASRATIATGLAQVLHDTFEADLVCVGLRAGAGAVACQAVWPATPREDALRDAICAAITRWCNPPDPELKRLISPRPRNPRS